MFSGSYVAIVTPWKDDCSGIDFDKLRELIEFQIENGTDGILPGGTTGESATLSHEEHRELIKRTVEYVGGRVKVLAGAGSNNTTESIGLAKFAKDAGADAALVITPYYNKPTPDGLLKHFAAVAEAADLPIMAYNVPGRTGLNMSPETTARIFNEVEKVVAIKEAGGSVDQVNSIRALCDITVMSGDDALTLPMISVGAKGVVSVAANVIPADVKAIVAAALAGDFAKAQELHFKALPVMRGMFVETNPIPCKTALKLMGMLNGAMRLPLCDLRPESLATLEKTLGAYGLL